MIYGFGTLSPQPYIKDDAKKGSGPKKSKSGYGGRGSEAQEGIQDKDKEQDSYEKGLLHYVKSAGGHDTTIF
jgi:hypothetical protein